MPIAAPTIDMTATGANIRALIKGKGLRVTDVQTVFGFNTPQAIFKWMRGDTMPSIDNIVITEAKRKVSSYVRLSLYSAAISELN